MNKNFPGKLWLIRHGESLANKARREAEEKSLGKIDFDGREMDVALSERGILQSERLGKWLAENCEGPLLVFSSPYRRTIDTARHLTAAMGLPESATIEDERLRERELGIFDRLTKIGAMEKYPAECEKRESIGKFYYRPPGGESWADVALRLRSFWNELLVFGKGGDAMIVSHEVVIRVFRYIIEKMGEDEILEIDRQSDIGNGAITSYIFDRGSPKIIYDNHIP